MSGFRSCSLPDFNTACDLRKQGYLRRQTTDYRRLARIQGSFSNKHPLAHSPRKATSNFDPKIQHHARKNPFCDAARHADSHLRKTMTARHSPHAPSPPAHYLRRAPCPAPAPLDSSRRHTALLPCTHDMHRPHPCTTPQRATTRTPPARYATAHSSPRPRFPSERHSQHPRAAAPCSHLVHPLVRIARPFPSPFSTPSFASRASFLTPSPPRTGANAVRVKFRGVTPKTNLKKIRRAIQGSAD